MDAGRRFYTEPGSGFSIWGNALMVQGCQFSPARMLRGHNWPLPDSQADLDQALEIAWGKVGVWGDLERRNFERWRFKRVDVAWDYPLDRRILIPSVMGCTHPRVRKVPVPYFGETAAWYGEHFEFVFYDKKLEASEGNDTSGGVMRGEARFKGRLCAKLFGTEIDQYTRYEYVTALDVDRCWRAYRAEVLKFCPKPVPQLATKYLQLLAMLHHNEPNPSWLPCPVLEWARAQMSRRNFYRLQAAVRDYRRLVHDVDLARFLPVSIPRALVYEVAGADLGAVAGASSAA